MAFDGKGWPKLKLQTMTKNQQMQLRIIENFLTATAYNEVELIEMKKKAKEYVECKYHDELEGFEPDGSGKEVNIVNIPSFLTPWFVVFNSGHYAINHPFPTEAEAIAAAKEKGFNVL